MKIRYKDSLVTFNINSANVRKIAAERCGAESEDNMPDSLVLFDPASQTITVDKNASKFYTKYAALHKCICCGHYPELAPEVDDPNKRCGEIDKMLLDSMAESEKKLYLAKRIEMFESLLENNLNPPLEQSFRESLNTLQSL